MKKLAAILVIVLAVGLITSCKPKEKCPAYGKNLPQKHQPGV